MAVNVKALEKFAHGVMKSLRELFPEKHKQILLTISVFEEDGKNVGGRSLWIPANMNMFEVLGHLTALQKQIHESAIKNLPKNEDPAKKEVLN